MLTRQQEMLRRLAMEKGFVTLGEAKIVYASPGARRAALQRLVKLGILRASNKPNRFDLAREVEHAA